LHNQQDGYEKGVSMDANERMWLEETASTQEGTTQCEQKKEEGIIMTQDR